jgi:hypothetical protein
MTTKPLKLMLATALSVTLAACATNDTAEEEPIEEEPVVEEEPVEETSPFTFIKSMPNISADTIPQYFNGYFFVKDTDNVISILDQDGNQTETGIKNVTFFDDTSAFAELYDDAGGGVYNIDFTTGTLGDAMMGGLGGVNPARYAYDESTGTVVTNEYNNTIVDDWVEADASVFETDEAVLLYSTQGLEDESNQYLDHYYIWQTATNKIYGPYEELTRYDTYYNEEGYTFYSLSTMSSVYSKVKGLYPRYILEGGGYLLVNGADTSEDTYEWAFPVANNAVVANNGDTYYLVLDTPTNLLELPDGATSSSKPSDTNTIMLYVDGEWQLWSVEI